jgi:hypothetical protein
VGPRDRGDARAKRALAGGTRNLDRLSEAGVGNGAKQAFNLESSSTTLNVRPRATVDR